jgi:hypothetical protein
MQGLAAWSVQPVPSRSELSFFVPTNGKLDKLMAGLHKDETGSRRKEKHVPRIAHAFHNGVHSDGELSPLTRGKLPLARPPFWAAQLFGTASPCVSRPALGERRSDPPELASNFPRSPPPLPFSSFLFSYNSCIRNSKHHFSIFYTPSRISIKSIDISNIHLPPCPDASASRTRRTSSSHCPAVTRRKKSKPTHRAFRMRKHDL